jgi:hypothetical protein
MFSVVDADCERDTPRSVVCSDTVTVCCPAPTLVGTVKVPDSLGGDSLKFR